MHVKDVNLEDQMLSEHKADNGNIIFDKLYLSFTMKS